MFFGKYAMSVWAIAGLVCGCCATASADPLTVKVEQGTIHGKAIHDGQVKAFLGLPYAAPPVGELRWKAPQPATRWQGVREATSFGAHCAQNAVFADMIFPDPGPSEDCLYLNVYAPASAKEGSKLPVMFWIHGGGYQGGAASEPRHNGDFLPTEGVVLVTINYRLGIFGFLTTEELAQESGGAAGNYGLMDMIAALQWVKANIASFGGDPGNVTIFGESAGSFAVSTLMASPMARGLFQKAIGESGSALGSGLGGKTVAQQGPVGSAWVASLGVKSLAGLRAMPTAALLDAAGKKGAPQMSTVIDGTVLVEPVADTYAAGRQAHLPLLAGWNRDEGSFAAARGVTAEQWKQQAGKLYGEHAKELLALYPGESDAQALRSAIDYAGDSFIALGTWKWIEAQAKTGQAPVYRYFFTLAAPSSKFHPGEFAFHSDDIEYVFGTLETRPGATWRKEDWNLSEAVMSYWTNFAKTGDPNGPGLAHWPRYDRGHELLRLDKEIAPGPDTTRERYEFLMKWMPPAPF